MKIVWSSIGSDDEIDENESQKEVSLSLKHNEFKEKLRSYYDASEVIRKKIPALKPRTIYNHYKLLNDKITNSNKKGSVGNFVITKVICLKIENLIKEGDFLYFRRY